MKRGIIHGLAWFLASGLILFGCGGGYEQPSDEPAADTAATEALADPGPDEAAEVEAFVLQWVADNAGEENVYGIPPRGDHAVSGVLTDFHTVHQKDAETYSVCVDFKDGENTYDVDFFVARNADGLAISDHYLHKVNGEAIE